MKTTITLIGCGNMGGSLLRGWLKSDLTWHYHVIKPNPLAPEFEKSGVTYSNAPDATLKKSDIVVMAVKPQKMKDVLNEVKSFIKPDALVISIAAGWSLANFENILGPAQPIIRTLPNLPTAIGKGLTIAIQNKNATPAHKKEVENLFGCVGKLDWLKDEAMMNAATVVSGAGPAFIFHMAEVLAKAGENNGVPPELARATAIQTLIGAAALMEARPETPPETLRENVTSPGGITAAALKILMNGELQKLYDDAVAAAAKRGDELSA